MENTVEEIQLRRKKALDKVNAEYYDRTSIHYRDNERFSWSVKAINKINDEDIEKLTPPLKTD